MRLLNEPECPSDFTVGWAAERVGMTEDEALEALCLILVYEPEAVELEEGSVRIVRCHSGNPRLLAALSLLWLELVNRTETGTVCFHSDYRLKGSRKEENA